MKFFFTSAVTIVMLGLLIIACEKRADPFSASNREPEIQAFSFEDDSLKFSTANPFKLTLRYRDEESQPLTATFKFVRGKGEIFDFSDHGEYPEDKMI